MLNNINVNDMIALKFVLEFISVEELLTNVMHQFNSKDDVKSKDNADVCFKAINAFLD